MKCGDREDPPHQEVMIEPLFGYSDPPKLVRIRFVRGGIACLGDKLVQELQISQMKFAWFERVGDDGSGSLFRSGRALASGVGCLFDEFRGVKWRRDFRGASLEIAGN